MNRPIRRRRRRLPVPARRAAGQRQPLQFVDAKTAAATSPATAGPAGEYSRDARPDRGRRRRRSRARCRPTTATSTSAPTRRARCTRPSPATTRSSTASTRHRAGRGRLLVRRRTTGCSSAGCRPVTGRQAKGGSVVLTIDPAAQHAAARALGRPDAARSSRSTRRPARSWRWSRHPSYDPNRLATHDTTAARSAWKALDRRPGAARCSTGRLPADLPAGLDVQDRHRRRGAVDRQYTPTSRDPGARTR